MSDKIECRGEIYVEDLHEVAPRYPIENLEKMFTKFPKSEVFLDCFGQGEFFLLVRTSKTRYAYLSDHPDDECLGDFPCRDAEWSRYMIRSYKIVRDTGIIPYAYKS